MNATASAERHKAAPKPEPSEGLAFAMFFELSLWPNITTKEARYFFVFDIYFWLLVYVG